MMRSAIFCAVGLLLGSFVGFFVANNSAPVTAVAPPQAGATGGNQRSAPPLDPNQSGELPANHPPMEGAANAPNPNDKSGGAATIPAIQRAMEEADRRTKDFDSQMRAAIAFYNNNAFDKAETYLKRALAIKPNDVDALKGLADTTYDKGDYATAQGYYEKVLAQRKQPDVQTDLGNTYFQRKDYARAIVEYRKALAIDPKHEKAWQNLAAAALRQGDKATTREAVDKLEAINPQNPAIASFRQSLGQ